MTHAMSAWGPPIAAINSGIVMKGPAPFRGGRVARGSVSLMDVMPTFLDWIGAPPLAPVDAQEVGAKQLRRCVPINLLVRKNSMLLDKIASPRSWRSLASRAGPRSINISSAQRGKQKANLANCSKP